MKYLVYLSGLTFGMLLCLGMSPLFGQEYLEMLQDPGEKDFYKIQQKANEYFEANGTGKGSGHKQWRRFEYMMEPRVYPSGKLINPVAIAWDEYHRYINQQSTLRSGQNNGGGNGNGNGGNGGNTLATSGYWTSLGPTDHTLTTGWNGGIGRVNCVAHQSASTFYVGTPAGGLWKTTNTGSTWTPLTDGMPIIGVSGIAIHNTNNNIIYILTGDGDGGDTKSIGVLKTTNGGQTWLSTGLSWDVTDNIRGYKLMMHPTNSNILFAVTNDGMWKTTNGGSSWTKELSGSFRDAEFKPGSPSTMYLVSRNQFYRSTDTGDNWTNITSGLPSLSTSTRIAMGVSPANSSYVYLLYGRSNGFYGLYRSFDSGLNFGLKSSTPNILGYSSTGSDTKSQYSYDLAIAVDPNNVGIVYIGGINVWKSTNFGSSWTISSYWREDNASFEYTHADIHALDFYGSTLYCGSDGGIYRTTNGGSNWSDISSGLAISQYYRISQSTSTSNLIIGGTQDNGCNEWTSTTNKHMRGADGMECIIAHNNNNIYYTTLQYGKMSKSTNGGASWTGVTPPSELDSDGNGQGAWVTPYIMHPTNSNILYAGYSDIHKTTNGGSTWTSVYSGSVDHKAMAMGTSNTSKIYAATSTVMRKSTNAGSTWSTITGTLPVGSASITYIAVNPSNSNDVFVTFSGYSAGNKVFRSTNSGTSWTNISGNLPNIPVNCIVYENTGGSPDDAIYIGTDVGIFYRDNTLGNWVPYMNGLPNVIVRELEINYFSNEIRAATHGRGLWESPLYSSCPSYYYLTNANKPGSGGYRYYQSSDSIFSSRDIDGGEGVQIHYASQQIKLGTGFHVESGSFFNAYLDNCGSGIPQMRMANGVYEGPMAGVTRPIVDIEQEVMGLPLQEKPMLVYPNPFSKRTNIEFTVMEYAPVTVEVMSTDGKRIELLIDNELLDAGTHTTTFDGSKFPDGIYYCRMIIGDKVQSQKMILHHIR